MMTLVLGEGKSAKPVPRRARIDMIAGSGVPAPAVAANPRPRAQRAMPRVATRAAGKRSAIFEDVWVGSKAAEGDVVRIEFSPLGTADTHTVHLKDEGQRRFTIHVNGITGSPMFHEERWDPPAPKRADEY